MPRTLFFGVFAIAVVACADDREAVVDGEAEHVRLRDDARLVLETHCGQCHIGSYPTALPRALAVFDLGDDEWSAHMSDLQLDDAAGRVRDRRGPDGPLDITDADVARVEAFVAHEHARRAP